MHDDHCVCARCQYSMHGHHAYVVNDVIFTYGFLAFGTDAIGIWRPKVLRNVVVVWPLRGSKIGACNLLEC